MAGKTYSYAQLEGLWIANGGNRAVAPVAAAIAEAESSGQSAVTSANPDGGINVGLWQLDTRGKGAGHTVAQLQDPATNAALAVKGSANGTDWSAWATYASGAYKRFMNGSTTPDMSVPGGGQAGASGDSGAPAGPDCAWSIGGQHVGILFGHGPSLPSACVIRKTEVRAVIGALILTWGGLIMLPGLVMVFAYGFKASGAAAATLRAAQYVPGGGQAVRGARAVGGFYAGRVPQKAATGGRGRTQPTTRKTPAKPASTAEGGGKTPPKPPVTDPAAGV